MFPTAHPTAAGSTWGNDASSVRMTASSPNPLVILGRQSRFSQEGDGKPQKPSAPKVVHSIKIQKKGAATYTTVPSGSVRTWDALLSKLRTLHGTSETPSIVTYSGDLLQDASSYSHALQQQQGGCLHLIISYPSDLSLLAVAFSTLLGRPPLPAEDAALVAAYTPAPQSRFEGGEPCNFRLRPPRLLFFTQEHIRCHVTMENAGLPVLCDFSRWKRDVVDKGKVPAGVSESSTPYSAPGAAAVAFGQEYGHSGGGENYAGYTTPTTATAEKVLQLASWQFWAACGQSQVLSTVSAEFTASPSGYEHLPAVLTDEVSLATSTSHQWAIYPDPSEGVELVDEKDLPRTSQIRVYASHDRKNDPDLEQRESQGWWMANTKMIPAGFAGREGERSFLCEGLPQTKVFLEGFLGACGLHGAERNDFITHWLYTICLSFPPSSSSSPESHLILIKFLTPRELRALLPLRINPVPHRLIRIFAVLRVVTRLQLLREGILAQGDFAREVEIVRDAYGAGGSEAREGRDGREREGLTVVEVGGALLLDLQESGKGSGSGKGSTAGGSREDTPALVADAFSEATQSPSREVTPGLLLGDEGMVEWRA